MKARIIVAAAAAALVVLSGAWQLRAEGPAPEPAGAERPKPPVTISADEAEYLGAEDRVVFTGKVVAVEGDATITADRLEVLLAPSGEEGEAPGGGMLAAADRETRIVSMLATGNVSFRQVDPESGVERFATGERGEYDAEARVVTVSGGSPRAWEGKNVMNCERMTFALEERNMKCFGKVNMTVYPAEREGGVPATGAPGGGTRRP